MFKMIFLKRLMDEFSTTSTEEWAAVPVSPRSRGPDAFVPRVLCLSIHESAAGISLVEDWIFFEFLMCRRLIVGGVADVA
jgi:hypothetical protein